MNRINPDSRGMLVVAVLVTGVLGCVSFILSYSGLVAVAPWANIAPELAWAVPVTVDGSILVYTIAALVFRARGERARIAWTALAVFASLSVIANGVHAWDAAPEWLRTVLGVGIAGLAPVAVLLATHTLARLIVAYVAVAPVAEVAPVADVEVAPRPSPGRQKLRGTARDAEIHRLAREEGLKGRVIAERMGVSPSTVSRVLDRPAPEVAVATT